MFLYEVFPPEMIIVGMNSNNKNETFEELTGHLCNLNEYISRDEVLSAIKEREDKMSTGIIKGIAIPHAISDMVSKIHGVLGISKKGINYNSLDGEAVHLVFMLLSPKEFTEKYLGLLTRLSTLLCKSDFSSELSAQNTSNEAYRVIRQFEENLSNP